MNGGFYGRSYAGKAENPPCCCVSASPIISRSGIFKELSFCASSLKDGGEGLIPCAAAPKGSVAPAAVVYGANASGKSNLVDAMEAMRRMVSFSQTHGAPDGGVPRQSFRLDPACSAEPSRFELDFVIGGVRHHYGFEASDDAFKSEWLYTFPKSHRRMLFEREDRKFHFGRGLKGRNAVIADLTRPNSLYLSAAAQNGHEQLSGVFEYFRAIHGVYAVAVPGMIVPMQLAREEPDTRTIDFLKGIGTGVVGYRWGETEAPEEIKALRGDIAAVLRRRLEEPVPFAELLADRQATIELAHRGRDGEPVYLDMDLESAGTRRLLVVLGHVFQALDKGAPMFIDEFRRQPPHAGGRSGAAALLLAGDQSEGRATRGDDP